MRISKEWLREEFRKCEHTENAATICMNCILRGCRGVHEDTKRMLLEAEAKQQRETEKPESCREGER